MHVFTIGHSDHPPDMLVSLLAGARIAVLVDVRSHPSSKWVAHANARDLERILKGAGIRYLFLGDLLGGRPEDHVNAEAEKSKVDYEALRRSVPFQQGLEPLMLGIKKYRVCIMCSEEDPSACHRDLLVGEAPRGKGVQVLHIRGSGAIETDEELRKRRAGVSLNQMELPFGEAT